VQERHWLTRLNPLKRLRTGNILDKSGLVLVIVDVSGSMAAEQLRLVESVLMTLWRKGATVLAVQADVEVKTKPLLFRGYGTLEKFVGRGGTSFSAALQYAETLVPTPDVVVYYTDGYEYGGLSRPPKVPVIWLLTESGESAEAFRRRYPFGDVVKVTS